MLPGTTRERIRCRLITDADLGAVVRLLCEGFSGRQARSWEEGLQRLRLRDVPDGMPRYGYCLDAGGRLVGVILLIASLRSIDGTPAPFANVASWYVNPDYRAYAQLLVSIALRNKDTTYTNISAAPHTWPIVEKQGYTRYCGGLFFAVAALNFPAKDVSVEAFGTSSDHVSIADHALLQRHHDMGCHVLVCRERDHLSGYVFRRYRIRSGRIALPAMLVIHAPDRDRLVHHAGNIGRHLMRSAAPILVMDADGPVDGLRGIYTSARGRKYFKGPHRPRLCDLADSEFAIFGV